MTQPEQHQSSPGASNRRMKIGVGIVIAALLLVLLGYVPAALRARRTAQDLERANAAIAHTREALEEARYDAQVARLRGLLGEALQELSINNFGTAASRATKFFDGVQEAMNSPYLAPGSRRRQVLEQVLARRDEIAADLARADQAARQKLAEMYMQFGAATEP